MVIAGKRRLIGCSRKIEKSTYVVPSKLMNWRMNSKKKDIFSNIWLFFFQFSDVSNCIRFSSIGLNYTERTRFNFFENGSFFKKNLH